MVKLENVMYCSNHEPVAIVTESKGPVQCKVCNELMTKIGWFESDSKQEDQEQEDRAGDE